MQVAIIIVTFMPSKLIKVDRSKNPYERTLQYGNVMYITSRN